MYSKSPPTGTPLAIRVTLIPVGLISLLMYIAVVLTIVSGAEYIIKNFDCINEM